MVADIAELCTEKQTRFAATKLCDKFISSATDEAAYGIGFAYFGHMRSAANAIPQEFENLDANSPVKAVDRRVQPYLRSQLFIALVAETEDLISQFLTLILRAYPQKITYSKVSINDLIKWDNVDEALEQIIAAELNDLFYKKPKDYRKSIDEILSAAPTLLDPTWPKFVEMKARRDIGLHNNWIRNSTYDRKVTEGGAQPTSETFLGVSHLYFEDSVDTSALLAKVVHGHCASKFKT